MPISYASYKNPVKAGLTIAPEEYAHGSLYLRNLKTQGLKPLQELPSVGTTEVVP